MNTSNPNQQGALPLNISLKDAEDIKCESCGGIIFEEKLMIKRISKLLTGGDRDSISPIPVIVCAKCNHVNELFKPKL
jgi:hypothetical protein